MAVKITCYKLIDRSFKLILDINIKFIDSAMYYLLMHLVTLNIYTEVLFFGFIW